MEAEQRVHQTQNVQVIVIRVYVLAAMHYAYFALVPGSSLIWLWYHSINLTTSGR